MKKCLLLLTAWLLCSQTVSGQAPEVRGEYLLSAGGCVTCHTADRDDAIALAGGRKFVTPFGTFYSPNITPDKATGIGDWSDEDFVAALHEGRRPDGGAYFPAFPYPAFTGMTRDDALAIKAYLFSQTPIEQTNQAHDLPWYLPGGLAARAWRWLFFDAGRFAPDPQLEAEWNRGAYLVRHLGHCGECHSPRNSFGVIDRDRELAGSPAGDFGRKVPNITPDKESGIGTWSTEEITLFLEIGILPDGDFTGASMSPVIDDNTSQLTAEDRQAIAVYLQSVPAHTFGE